MATTLSANSLRVAKTAMRKELKTVLKAIAPEIRSSKSRKLVSRVLASPEYAFSRRVSIYLSMSDEVETDGLLMDLFATGRSCFIPRYSGDTMEMLRLDSLSDFESLPTTAWNIKQPADHDTARENALKTGGLDLIIVPGLGFSLDGRRLGRGKGYYDRFIQECLQIREQPPHLIALAFQEQIRDSIPVSETDMKVDHVFVE